MQSLSRPSSASIQAAARISDQAALGGAGNAVRRTLPSPHAGGQFPATMAESMYDTSATPTRVSGI